MPISLSLYNHDTDRYYQQLSQERVVERARKLAPLRRLRRSADPLVDICMEIDGRGRVTKNCLGVLDLAWQAARHPEWAGMIHGEIEQNRAAIRAAHGVELRYLIWAGMGGSAEDKKMYEACGLLKGSVSVYILDSTDPAKLAGILAGMTRGGKRLERALRQTLVVGMAMGMTSYEPVVNLEKLHLLFRKHKIPSQANFLYMTLPGSLLDRFAGPRGYRRVELQPDNDNTVAGRHSGPLTRGSLYPLALNGVNLDAWIGATALSEAEVDAALRLAAFLHGNGVQSRDKVILLLPPEWRGAGVWTKQDFEESLGKSEQLGIKIFPGFEPGPGRVFWAVQVRGCHNLPSGLLRSFGHPLAVTRLGGPMALPRYMQWVHYVVFGLACLRRMNFVTQPSVELYKQITNRLHRQSRRLGKVERTREWQALARSRHHAGSLGVTLHYDSLLRAGLLGPKDLEGPGGAPGIFARALLALHRQNKIEYGELTFYGDMRYQEWGRRLRTGLEIAGVRIFNRMAMPADVYEGPAMNHSYHEMIIGHGRCFSVVLLARRQAAIDEIGYRADYHKAQWLATKLALEQRGWAVVGITFPDMSETGLRALDRFLHKVAAILRRNVRI
jgi:glucose-6-phosphate isomerase